ncbi:hypothetical protein RQP46_003051 [Phenoliferia psychrophenolica]
MSSHFVVKVTLNHSPVSQTTRKLLLPRATVATDGAPYTHLCALVKERFSLPAEVDIALLYFDAEDGEELTCSSDDELREYIQSLDPKQSVLRFSLVFLASPTDAPAQYHSAAGSEHHTTSPAPSERDSVHSLYESQLEHRQVQIPATLLPREADTPADAALSFSALVRALSSTPEPPLDQSSHVATAFIGSLPVASEESSADSASDDDGEDGFELLSEFGSDGTDVPEPETDNGKGRELRPTEDDIRRDIERLDLAASEPAATETRAVTPLATEVEVPVSAENEAVEDPVDEPLSSPAVNTTAEDPADAPLPSDSSEPSPAPFATTPFPLAHSSFFSFLPPTVTASLQGLIADPSAERFQRHLPTSATTLDELPHVALGLAGEMYSVLNEVRESVRKEAEGLRQEFEEFKQGVAEEAGSLRAAFADAAAGDAAQPSPPPMPSQAQAQTDRERAEDHIQRNVDETAESAPKMKADWDAEKKGGDRVKDAEREHARKVKKEVEKALKEAKRQRNAAKEERRASKELRRAEADERRAETERKKLERSFSRRQDPFDDAYEVDASVSAPLLPATGPTRKTHDHKAPTFAVEREAHRAARTPPPHVAELASSPVLNTVPIETDDLFVRRTRASMPGSFEAPTTAPTGTPSPFATSPIPIAPYPTLPRFAPRSIFTSNAPRPSEPIFRMPGSFNASHTTPHPAPIPSSSATPYEPAPVAGEEVLPSQLHAAIKGLGFDMKDLGVRIAVERSWEEGRGKKLEVLVEKTLEKILM